MSGKAGEDGCSPSSFDTIFRLEFSPALSVRSAQGLRQKDLSVQLVIPLSRDFLITVVIPGTCSQTLESAYP